MTTIPVDLGDDVSNDLINSLMGSNRQTTNNQGSNPEMWLQKFKKKRKFYAKTLICTQKKERQ